MALEIAGLLPEDWPSVRDIYIEGIATGNATFETEPPTWERWDAAHLAVCRLAARRDGRVVGWAALSPTSSRPVYRGVVEESIYIAAAARGQRVGLALMQALIEASEAAGFWTLQAGIFPENSASLALHRRCGFRVVGLYERIGKMRHGPYAGEWRSTLLLERRSAVAGID